MLIFNWISREGQIVIRHNFENPYGRPIGTGRARIDSTVTLFYEGRALLLFLC